MEWRVFPYIQALFQKGSGEVVGLMEKKFLLLLVFRCPEFDAEIHKK